MTICYVKVASPNFWRSVASSVASLTQSTVVSWRCLLQPKVSIKDVPKETWLQTEKTEEELNSTALYLADLQMNFKEFDGQCSSAVRCSM